MNRCKVVRIVVLAVILLLLLLLLLQQFQVRFSVNEKGHFNKSLGKFPGFKVWLIKDN